MLLALAMRPSIIRPSSAVSARPWLSTLLRTRSASLRTPSRSFFRLFTVLLIGFVPCVSPVGQVTGPLHSHAHDVRHSVRFVASRPTNPELRGLTVHDPRLFPWAAHSNFWAVTSLTAHAGPMIQPGETVGAYAVAFLYASKPPRVSGRRASRSSQGIESPISASAA